MTNSNKITDTQRMNTEYLAQVAYLRSRGFTQQEIGGLLGLNTNGVARLVRSARALGLLKRPVFSEEVFLRLWPDPKRRLNLENLRFGLKLLKGLKDNAQRENRRTALTQVKVVSTVSYETTSDAWTDRLCDFGRQALPYFHEVLFKAEICAMGWGGTDAALVSAAEREGFSGKVPHPTLAATCGELFDYLKFGNASSSLVERLHLLLDGKKSTAYTLRGVPALLNDPSLREFYLQKHPGYHAVFGPRRLVDRFDAIVTSAGTSVQQGVHAFKRALIAEWGVTEDTLKEISWGDLGGVLVPRKNLSIEGKKEFERISSLWTGITLEHYRETAKRAAELATSQAKEIPGVVVFAIGNNKAEIVHEIAKAGLVNRIVIDLDLAKALAARADIDLAKDVRSSYRAEGGIETIQEIIMAFDNLPADEKSAVCKHLLKA